MATIDVYERSDSRFAWRIIADNGEIIATDGGQGYENAEDALGTATKLASGGYSVADKS